MNKLRILKTLDTDKYELVLEIGGVAVGNPFVTIFIGPEYACEVVKEQVLYCIRHDLFRGVK